VKKIYIPMIRYGDKDFDESYLGWGFQNVEEQTANAEGILNLVRRNDMAILDLGCGLGNYHRVWLEAGHAVTGVDFSETFIVLAGNTNSKAAYINENYYDLQYKEKFDLVTLIDIPLEDDDVARVAFNALKSGGQFVFQAPNPKYAHARGPQAKNNRNWRENDDCTFLLTRNEYNKEIDRWEYEEWHINLEEQTIEVEHSFSRNLSYSRMVDILLAVGFASVSFLDGQGRAFDTGAEDLSSYFCVAHKGEY